MTDETNPVPTFDPTWLRGDMFGMPQDVNDAEDEGEPQHDTVIARLTAERDRARATAIQLEQELARVRHYLDVAKTLLCRLATA
jgi:hypothetical protein